MHENFYTDFISQALDFIGREQLSDGSFSSFSTTNPEDFSDALVYSTTFFTSNILSCLADIDGTQEICARAAKFLLSQKSEQWSFNYWGNSSPERKTMPYPDDLDDTFAALAALAKYDRRLIGGDVLAGVVKLLTATEIHVGGPYRTWLIDVRDRSQWNDVDIVVNSTIGYFLSLSDIRLPNLEQSIEAVVEENNLSSPYYPSSHQVAYFVSRFYKGMEKEKLILKNPENVLERAMRITTLLNLDLAEGISSNEIAEIIDIIGREGFGAYPFCIDPARDGKKSYAGAPSLTAALCIEAVSKWLAKQKKSGAENIFNEKIDIHKRIKNLAQNECTNLKPELKAAALEIIEQTSDKRITSLAYEFREALGEQGKNIPAEIIDQLALGNFYGWMAYTIYDDFLDGEGEPKFLSTANYFSRKLGDIYSKLEKNIPGIKDLFDETMNMIDAANAWEQKYCRGDSIPDFGDYENLADRSIGHAMGPLALLLAIGYTPCSKEYAATLEFFRHYLIARQLHDDAHDWADDLARGQINSVGALVLAECRESPEAQRHFFWTTIIDRVVEIIREHIARARSARAKFILLHDSQFMEEALAHLEKSAIETLAERDETLKFLSEYNKVL